MGVSSGAVLATRPNAADAGEAEQRDGKPLPGRGRPRAIAARRRGRFALELSICA